MRRVQPDEYDDPQIVQQVMDALAELRELDKNATTVEAEDHEKGGGYGQHGE